MKYSLAFLTAVAVVHASPVAFPQAVTAAISPDSPAPSGCTDAYDGTFGIVVMNVTAAASGAAVSQVADGQPQGGTSAAAPVTSIADGQPQAPTGAPVSTIADGQPQAPTGAPAAPVTQISDGQIQGPTAMPAVSQIGDGQIQAPTMTAVSQIGDGQIQAPAKTAPAVSQISDGQIQAPPSAPAVSQISDGQPQAPSATAPAATQLSDGQPQAPKATAPAASQISDGQPQAPAATAPAASQISDGQPQAPAATGASQLSDGQPQAPAATASAAPAPKMVACSNDDTLAITLEGGILKDDQGRIGYIAANYQFQFDGPPQAGAIYTAGWSVCGNGSLALGGSTTFYQCLSGSFYNLYNENWAAQCNAVTIDVLDLIDCPAR